MTLLDTDEKLDTIPGTNLKLIQKIGGTAFTIDTLLLAQFLKFTDSMTNVADLGSGNGILSFLVKFRKSSLQVTGFEIQQTLYELSIRNISLNSHFDGIYFELLDIKDAPSRILPETFDLVVSNPPYFKLGNGRIPPDEKRAISRHELKGSLRDFVEAAVYMLPYAGRFSFVLPTSRFYEACEYLKENNMGLKRLQFVHPKQGEPSHLALIEAERFYNGRHESLPSITIHETSGGYTQELNLLFSSGLQRL